MNITLFVQSTYVPEYDCVWSYRETQYNTQEMAYLFSSHKDKILVEGTAQLLCNSLYSIIVCMQTDSKWHVTVIKKHSL